MAKAAAQFWLQLCFEVLDLDWSAFLSTPPEKLSSAGRIPQDTGGEEPCQQCCKASLVSFSFWLPDTQLSCLGQT